ncbi:MAG TPA: EcsC family protein [Flavisolibacter sp.]
MQYEQKARQELQQWKRDMLRHPSFFNNLSKRMQTRLNSYIPEKVHKVITSTIKQMIRGVLFGATYTTSRPVVMKSLEETETQVDTTVRNYRRTAAAEGGVTGAGGILLGIADFPILLGIKLKLLFDIAVQYGFDTRDYRERLYLLHIFQLAFSSHEHRRSVFLKMQDWEQYKQTLPEDIHQFDWRIFQQEYRDYIDLAKMAQLIPGIGAVVGIIVNYRLISKLAVTAKNSYRMRLLPL